MDVASAALAFLAGGLSIFSPCVLPLVPVVLATPVAQHRFGPMALAAGLAISFLALGLFVATIGFSIGLDTERFRTIAAILLMLFGAVLIVPDLRASFSLATGPLGNWITKYGGRLQHYGLAGQFGVGLLLGAAWIPCVGPTLGAATVLAAQGRDLMQVGFVMFAFAVGTALPLLALGLLSRQVLLRWRGRMLSSGSAGKIALGAVLIAMGILILTGYDKIVETALLNVTPIWLTELTTRF